MNFLLRNKLITLIFIILILIPLPALAASQWETKEIDYENFSVTSAEISGNHIILLTSGEGMTQTENKINLYTIDSGEREIIGIPSKNMTVTGEDISGDYAVWFETEADNFNSVEQDTLPDTIFLMNIPENDKKALDLPGSAEWPKISGNNIFWSNSSETSLETGFDIYNINTGESKEILKTECFDSAGIVYSNDRIAYEDTTGLHIYEIETGKDTIIYASKSSNESGSSIDSFDMAGNILVYTVHTAIYEGDDKGTYYEPFIYTISDDSTMELNPKTGEISSGTLTNDDKKISIISPFTDGKRAGWGYLKGESDSEIILIDTETKNVTTITASGSISDIHLDGKRMIWLTSHFPSFDSSLVYAEEKETAEGNDSQSAPGFSPVIVLLGIFCLTFILKRELNK